MLAMKKGFSKVPLLVMATLVTLMGLFAFSSSKGDAAMLDYWTYASGKGTSTLSHNFQFEVVDSIDHTGRLATYEIKSPSGKLLQSGSAALYKLTNYNGETTDYFATPTKTFSFSGYLDGNYTITYTYKAGTASWSSTKTINIQLQKIANIK